jgi:hypothetical protein
VISAFAARLLPSGIGPNPVDEPTLPPGFDPNTVTPGVEGFIAIALVAIAAMFLIVDMTRRIRRVRYRGELREQLEAEQRMIDEGGPVEPEPDEPESDDSAAQGPTER